MIALQNIELVDWEDTGHWEDGMMLRVPYLDIEEIVEKVKDTWHPSDVFLLAPYKADDPSFNARSASVLWDRLPQYSVFMPVATSNRIAMQDFVVAALKAGQRKLVVPYRYGYNRQYRFDQLMQFLHGTYDESTWIHVAGGAPELPDHWPGIWSWSEEEL